MEQNKMNSQANIAQNSLQMYDYQSIAAVLNVAIGTVRNWRQKRQMPQPDIQEHRFVRWKAETIEPFLKDPISWRQENNGNNK